MSAYRAPLRDRVAWWLACRALSIGGRTYRQMIYGAIEYGLRTAARDERAAVPAPDDWRRSA